MPLYDRIGQGYDHTRRADPEIVRRLLRTLRPHPDGRYLDLACGSGNYTVAIAKSGLRIDGVDHSPRMIAAARSKDDSIPWHLADVEALPFPDGTFAGVLCTLAIHHFPRRDVAFAEVFRVLQEGRLVLLTATPEQMRSYWLNEYFPAAMEQAMAQMPPWERVRDELQTAGFRVQGTEPYRVAPDLQDLFLYSGKHRPELYLDPAVRAGISTFAFLADPEEVRQGCERLEADLHSGRFVRIAARYADREGDYLFAIAEKTRSG